jgi:PAS domain S-box-containing protein
MEGRDRTMNGSRSELSVLRDSRLALHATSPLPAWLWRADGTRIVWANPVGAAMFGAASVAAVSSREFEPTHPSAGQVARLAATLARDGPPRLERLRGFGVELGRALTCSCSQITLPDGTAAILIAANESAGPALSLSERVHRLLAGSDKPVAAYSATGQLLCATQSAHAHVGGATSLAALGAQDLALTALANGHAAGVVGDHRVSVDRVGSGSATVLIAHFAIGKSEGEIKPVVPATAEQADTAPASQHPVIIMRMDPANADPASSSAQKFSPSQQALVRRHPLRFVWQLNEQGRFSIDSDEFLAVVGERTAAAVGRRWEDIAAELDLDRDGQIARAIATRDTWSGLTVNWPVDGEQEALCVELSGLPVFDRERIFRGYRGFGVCRDLARLTALARSRAAGDEESRTAVASTGTAKNIVPFPSSIAETAVPALTPVEHMAFRELSRKLTQGLAAAGVEREVKVALRPPYPYTQAAQRESAQQQEVDLPAEPAGTPSHALLDQLPVGILVYRVNQLLYANPAFLRLTGYATLEQFSAEGGLDQLFIEPLGAAVAGKEQFLRLAIRRDEQITLEGELIPIDWEGEPAHAAVIARRDDNAAGTGPIAPPDITELKAILDAAGDGIVLIDAQGIILFASRNAQALFGYEPHQLQAIVFTRLLSPENADMAHDQLDEVVRGGPGARRGREVMGRTRQGSSVPLFMTIAPLANRPDRFCVAFSDIRQWKQAEQELVRARRRAENASAAKSDFLAKISHEIRTPLNSIIGFSEVMLAEQFGRIENDRYREYLKDIHASGQHLLSLVNDLLDLSKIEAGKLELNFSSVALNELVQQCVAVMQPQSSRERIIIRTSLPPELPRVVADARTVRQILLNVLSNSLKFTGAGGQIIISTAVNGDREVVLHVRDTGIGMTEQDVATALEPFRQLSTSPAGGAGLGLPLTKALAEANRAKFRLTSAPKEGTLVEIVFPASSVLSG